ncbi:MAG: hypothetical protein U9R79_20590 [Armatimonadota bacterium]|nr:hypothetical protein [Armatimonadota bacterium]
MLRNIPYAKTILVLGVGALVLAVVGLTWVYPAYVARVTKVKERKTREFCESNFGVSGDSMEFMKSSASLGHELADTLGGADVPPLPVSPQRTPTDAANTTEPGPKPASAPQEPAHLTTQ